jgi:hypothetical protein
VFQKTIDALKATETAAQEELDALFVPFDKETGTGGVHWHAAGSSILQNAIRGIAGLRTELEQREAPIAQAEADAAKQAALQAAADTPSEESTETASEETAETEVTTSA